jgi:hypothetical protein
MKIIITENQFNDLSKQQLKQSLFKYWGIQKKRGNTPELDYVVFDVVGVDKYSSDDFKIVRPIWYEYNGGFEKVFSELKEKTKGKPFKIKGDNNLNIIVYVDYLIEYGAIGGYVDVICSIYGGTIDYEFYTGDSTEPFFSKGADIFDVYSDLEYDTHDFKQFINDTISEYFDKKFEYLGIPLYVEATW